MSRIGKLPVALPSGVNVTLGEDEVHVKGPNGELRQHILAQAVIANMVEGVSKGFRKSLEIQGVGYRAAKAGEKLNLTLGYSHPVVFAAPKGVSLSVEGQNKIHVDGIDKQQVGQVAAEIRNLRPPEPYKGKGIRYEGELVRKKLGKAGKAGKK